MPDTLMVHLYAQNVMTLAKTQIRGCPTDRDKGLTAGFMLSCSAFMQDDSRDTLGGRLRTTIQSRLNERCKGITTHGRPPVAV